MVAGLAAFVVFNAGQRARSRTAHQVSEAIRRDTLIVSKRHVQAVVRRELAVDGTTQSTPPTELRRRVRNLASGTYIGDILDAQDSALYHWRDHFTDALRVYIESNSTVAGWSGSYPAVARDVFDEWSEAGFPLRFTFIYDSASADIGIHWLDHFPARDGRRIGVTDRHQSSAYLIVKARIAIANHDSVGHPLSPTVVAGIVRHEVGHALGLNHSHDRTSVMYRESATSAISASDRATLRLLYQVPPGSLK